MFARFMSRLAAHGLLLVGFFSWWFANRAVSWTDKLLALAVFVLGSALVLTLADPSIGVMSIFMMTAPVVFTVWVAWLWLSRDAAPSVRRAGLAVVILLVLASLDFIRWDGLEGNQKSELSWRWSPTAEQIFLASHEKNAADSQPAAPLDAWEVQPGDVPGFRGKARDGVAAGDGLALDWSERDPQKIWRQRLGPGWSSLIVVDGHVVTQEQRDAEEVIVCYDSATGKELWVHADKVRFHEGLSGAGPRGTPEFADGKIYALGGTGILNCLDAASGKLLWSHDLVQAAKAVVPQWGFAVSPLVVDGQVIAFAPGKEAAGLVAYAAISGEPIWKSVGGGDTYSSPQRVDLDGVPQILMQDSVALRAHRIEDGKVLWEVSNGSEMSVPMLQPRVVSGNQVLAALEPGLTLLEVTEDGGQWKTREAWISNRIRPNFNDIVTHKGKIYGLDDGILCALDLETGERLWKKGRYGHGQVLLLADRDALLVLGARGEVTLVGIGGDAPEVLGEFASIEGKTWNHPALVGQRLFVRNGEEIACYELPTAATEAAEAAAN